MTIPIETVFIGGVSILVTVISWFIKRDIARFEKVLEKHSADLADHSKALATVAQQVAAALEVAKWIPHLNRFFGDGGGLSRVWRNIEQINFDIEQCRERDHWFVNRLSVIKGSMEMQNLKCGGDQSSWTCPAWKHAADDSEDKK